MSKKITLLLLFGAALGVWLTRGEEPAASEVLPSAEAFEEKAVDYVPLPILSAREPLPHEGVADVSELRLHLRILTSTKRTDGEPVGGVQFALDVGYIGEQSVRLFEGRTDRDGRLDVELPWSQLEPFAGDQRARLFGTPLSDGYQSLRSATFLPQTLPDAVVQLVVVMRPGGTVSGTLLDAAGRPSGGRVRAELAGSHSASSTSARVDGSFQIHLAESGTYLVLATDDDGPDPGTAVLGPLAIDLADPPPLDLRLVGPGRLRGQVLDGQGLPAAGLELLVRVQSADVAGGEYAASQDVRRRLELDGAGLPLRFGTTDADGRFDFRGLRDDLYVVRARTDARSSAHSHLLTPVAVESDGAELHLRFDRPYLVVRTVDPEGRPVDARPVPRYRFLDDWPEQHSVLVLRAPEDARTSDPRWLSESGVVSDVGVLVYELSVPADWIVTLLGPGRFPRSKRVQLREDSGRVECELVMGDPIPVGTLVVDVVDDAGLPVREDARVRVLDPATEVCLIEAGEDDTWPVELEVPAGDYSLVVEGAAFIGDHHGTLLEHRAHGGCRLDASVRPGERVEITARLDAPARLDLELVGEGTGADEAAIRAEFEGQPQGFVDMFSGRAEVLLWPPTGYPVDVEFAEEAWEGTSAFGIHLFSSLTIGTRATSEALTPGAYRLEVRMPGGREASRSVVLVPGQTLHVRLDLGN